MKHQKISFIGTFNHVCGFSLSKKKRTRGLQAFTLVEVLISMAVVSIGMIGIMGLLAGGLHTFRDAIITTTESEITQQIANQLQLAPYSTLATSTQMTSYFTDEGVLTNSPSVYTVTVSSPVKVVVPSGTGVTLDPSTNCVTFNISVCCQTYPHATNATTIQIANNGF